MISKNCKNCDTANPLAANYCLRCGQQLNLHRLNWRYLFHESVHYFTHADKGIFHLLKYLTLTSGSVAKEYLLGKRKKYFPPLNFFLIVAAIYVISASWNDKSIAKETNYRDHPEIANITNPVKKEATIKIYERAEKSRLFLNKHANLLAIAALPFISFIFFIFYQKSGYNYVEHLLANMYMTAYTLLVKVIIFTSLFFILPFKNGNSEIAIFFLFQIIYFTWFYYRFTAAKSKLKIVKAFFVSLLAVACWVALSGSLIRFYIQNGLWGLLK